MPRDAMAHAAEPSDEALMARYQAKLDGEAFQTLVSRFLAPAVGVACQLLGDRALAEDATQEAFLRVVRGRERYDAARPFSSWFYAILRNVCTDFLRRRARRASALREVARQAPTAQSPRDEALDAWDLLSRLPEEARAVLVLRVVQGLAFRDVAAALGISEEAAKKRGQRALRKLRKLSAAQELIREGADAPQAASWA
ncbi:MAG: RNA polymerase sigma factor [Candidatus Brocadiia bacterium]